MLPLFSPIELGEFMNSVYGLTLIMSSMSPLEFSVTPLWP